MLDRGEMMRSPEAILERVRKTNVLDGENILSVGSKDVLRESISELEMQNQKNELA